MKGKKLVYGVGINDAEYTSKNGVKCHYYVTWHSMMARCYNDKFHKKQPTYKDCTVCDEWLTFSRFKLWMEKKDWKGKELDKDILTNGAKSYSQETCIFVSREVNALFKSKWTIKNKLKKGVTKLKEGNNYVAHCRCNGKVRHLGTFISESTAFKAYKSFKYMVIAMAAEYQLEPLKSAMLNYKIKG